MEFLSKILLIAFVIAVGLFVLSLVFLGIIFIWGLSELCIKIALTTLLISVTLMIISGVVVLEEPK